MFGWFRLEPRTVFRRCGCWRNVTNGRGDRRESPEVASPQISKIGAVRVLPRKNRPSQKSDFSKKSDFSLSSGTNPSCVSPVNFYSVPIAARRSISPFKACIRSTRDVWKASRKISPGTPSGGTTVTCCSRRTAVGSAPENGAIGSICQ